MDRRQFILSSLTSAIIPSRSASAFSEETNKAESFKIGLTPVFLDDRIAFIRRWQVYLEKQLGIPVEFVQKNNYQSVVDMLLQGNIDFAWICGYPYVKNKQEIELLSVPLYKAHPTYQAYIIVHKDNHAQTNMGQLGNSVFAYADSNSNSGFLYPQYLKHTGRLAVPFRKYFFTYSHRKTIEAVAEGLAQAAAVDGYVWDTMQLTHPSITAQTQIIHRSPDFAFPPFVTHTAVSSKKKTRLAQALKTMHLNTDGQNLLQALNLTQFDGANEALFESISLMINELKDKRYD